MLHVQRPPREWASSRDCFWFFLSRCCFWLCLAPLYLLYWVYYHCQVATSLEQQQQLNTTPRAVRTTNNPRLLVLFFLLFQQQQQQQNSSQFISFFLSFFFLEASRVLSFAHLLLRLEKEMSSHFICTCHQNLFWKWLGPRAQSWPFREVVGTWNYEEYSNCRHQSLFFCLSFCFWFVVLFYFIFFSSFVCVCYLFAQIPEITLRQYPAVVVLCIPGAFCAIKCR